LCEVAGFIKNSAANFCVKAIFDSANQTSQALTKKQTKLKTKQ